MIIPMKKFTQVHKTTVVTSEEKNWLQWHRRRFLVPKTQNRIIKYCIPQRSFCFLPRTLFGGWKKQILKGVRPQRVNSSPIQIEPSCQFTQSLLLFAVLSPAFFQLQIGNILNISKASFKTSLEGNLIAKKIANTLKENSNKSLGEIQKLIQKQKKEAKEWKSLRT